jgi:hypothetical protein
MDEAVSTVAPAVLRRERQPFARIRLVTHHNGATTVQRDPTAVSR